MTETSTIPFDTQQQAPASTGPQFEAEPAGNRTKLLALAGGAGVLVLAVAGYFLLFAGGDSPAGKPSAVPTHAVPAPSASAPVAGAAKSPKISPKSFGHDPFKALIVATANPAGAVGGTGTSTTTGTTTGAGTGTGTTTGTTTGTGSTVGGTGSTTTGGSTGTTTGTTTPVVTANHTFRVVKVASDNSHVTVNVDGVSYPHLAAGQVFATYFKVVVIGGKVNGFQFGDEKFSVFGSKKLFIAS
jgi:hypothetical protein